MQLIAKDDYAFLEERFEELRDPVQLLFFTSLSLHEPAALESDERAIACETARQLYQELSRIDSLIEFRLHDIDTAEGRQAAGEAGINEALLPAVVLRSEVMPGVSRFYGIPAGFELGAVVENIVALSNGQVQLTEKTHEALLALIQPAHIVVFVTPTCTYCSSVVRTAHQMAMVSPLVSLDVIQANEFIELASAYGVFGVPKTVINDKVEFDGPVPEPVFINHIQRAVEI